MPSSGPDRGQIESRPIRQTWSWPRSAEPSSGAAQRQCSLSSAGPLSLLLTSTLAVFEGPSPGEGGSGCLGVSAPSAMMVTQQILLQREQCVSGIWLDFPAGNRSLQPLSPSVFYGLFIYLKDRTRGRDVQSAGLLPKWPKWPDLVQAKVRAWERQPGLPCGWQEPKHLDHFLQLSQVH